MTTVWVLEETGELMVGVGVKVEVEAEFGVGDGDALKLVSPCFRPIDGKGGGDDMALALLCVEICPTSPSLSDSR